MWELFPREIDLTESENRWLFSERAKSCSRLREELLDWDLFVIEPFDLEDKSLLIREVSLLSLTIRLSIPLKSSSFYRI